MKNFWKYFIFVFQVVGVLSIFGCATTNGVGDYRNVDENKRYVVTEPLARNGYRGLLFVTSTVPDSDIQNRAIEICSTRGGLKTAPAPTPFPYGYGFSLGWKYYAYFCNGNPATLLANINKSDVERLHLETEDSKRKQAEAEEQLKNSQQQT